MVDAERAEARIERLEELIERLGTATVLTLDRRHFAAVRPAHCESLQLLPE